MFICEPCLEENYNNTGFMKSSGPCEICNKKQLCYEIPSKHLILKEKRDKYGKIRTTK